MRFIFFHFSSHDADDEFVSESFQGATKKEMAEVNESMRRLGLGGGGGKLVQQMCFPCDTLYLNLNNKIVI